MVLHYLITYLLQVIEYGNSIYASILNFFSLIVSFTLFVRIYPRAIKRIRTFPKKGIYYPLTIFLFLLVLSFMRTNNPYMTPLMYILRLIKFALFIINTIGVFDYLEKKSSFEFKKFNSDKYYFKILVIPSVFIILNFILYAVFPRNDIFGNISKGSDLGNSITISSLLNIDISRVNFPLTAGINSYGTYTGCVAIMALILFFTLKKLVYKITAMSIFMCTIITLALIDTRSAILLIIIVTLLTWIFSSLKYIKTIKSTLIVGSILPIIIIYGTILFSLDSSLSDFSRGDDDFKTGNNRSMIWLTGISDLSNIKLKHIFGYGEFGQTGSKISDKWAGDFYIFENPKMVSMHNIFLQFIFDIGYIGLISFIWLMFSTINAIRRIYIRTQDPNVLAFLSFNMLFLWIGNTEAPQTHGGTLYMFIYIALAIYIFEASIFQVENLEISYAKREKSTTELAFKS